MRCLTLATALKQKGAQILFVSWEHAGHLCEQIAVRGFSLIRLPVERSGEAAATDADAPPHAHWLGASWKQDAEETQEAIRKAFGAADWLVVDHYALDARWEAALRPCAKRLMVIDDLADRAHDCDLLLDQNFFRDGDKRYSGKTPSRCGQMLGPRYALLQPEYAELRERIPSREGSVRRILVSFGAADASNLAGMAIEAFLSLDRLDIELDVVANQSSPHAESLRRQTAARPNIHLHGALPSLAPLIARADLAIGACGATTWERLCLGLPSLVITLADNQRQIAAELARQGAIRLLGHVGEVDVVALARVLRELVNEGLPEAWSQACRELVDGRGTRRACSALTLSPDASLRARLARLDDEALLLQWANDLLVRQNAFSTAAIAPATHRAWFRDRLRDLENCRLYVVETEEGFPVGQVRFQRSRDGWETDYALDSCCRGRGVGQNMLETAILKLRSCEAGAVVFASVKAANLASRRIFEGLGFEAAGDKSVVGGGTGPMLSIAVCSDVSSWINSDLPNLLLEWIGKGHRVSWAHNASQLSGGDICFFLSYSRIVNSAIRNRYQHNLVVHESDLPRGRGWSPMTWLVLEGKERIPVTLLNAGDAVDSGDIYMQLEIELTGSELVDELRAALTKATFSLCRNYVEEYPASAVKRVPQVGEPTYYPRRRPEDSIIDVNQSLAAQFNLLRVVDNERYPGWFEYNGCRYLLYIENMEKKGLGSKMATHTILKTE